MKKYEPKIKVEEEKLEEDVLEASRRMIPLLADVLSAFAGQYGDPKTEVKMALGHLAGDIEDALDVLPWTEDQISQDAFIKEFKRFIKRW